MIISLVPIKGLSNSESAFAATPIIRKINIRLNDYNNEIFTCNLFRTYDDSHSHVRYITYTLSLDEAETVEDIDAIFNTDEDTQGNPVESKGVLFRISCCDQDLV